MWAANDALLQFVGEEIADGAADDIGDALQCLYGGVASDRLRQSATSNLFSIYILPFIGDALQCIAALFNYLHQFHVHIYLYLTAKIALLSAKSKLYIMIIILFARFNYIAVLC